jgi:hypothetical protein
MLTRTQLSTQVLGTVAAVWWWAGPYKSQVAAIQDYKVCATTSFFTEFHHSSRVTAAMTNDWSLAL